MFLFPLFFGGVISSKAQNASVFSFVPPYGSLNTDQNKVLALATNAAVAGSLQYISWTNNDLVGSDGKIRVTLPLVNGGQQMVFDVVGSFFTNSTDYAITGRNNLGQISLFATSVGKGATLDIGASQYKVYPLGDTKGVFIQTNAALASGSCDNLEPSQQENPIGFCEDDCGDAILDVLYMITPEANQWLSDTYGIFGWYALFQEAQKFNLALANSVVTNKRARFKFINYTTAFPLGEGSNKLRDDCSELNDPVNGSPSDAVLTLQQYGADIGVLWTNLAYNGANEPYGFSSSNATSALPNNERFSCIQVYTVDGDQLNHSHELGHQMGCTHGTESTGPAPGCPNGKLLPINNKTTIMAQGSGTRIPYFSNPEVPYMQESTGETGVRNNAAQLRGALCVIADNHTPTFFDAHYVNGPITPFLPFHASATVDPGMQEVPGFNYLIDCPGPYTYEWSWSLSQVGPFTPVGSNSPVLDLKAPPACPMFYLKLRVLAGACVGEQIKLIICQSTPGLNMPYNPSASKSIRPSTPQIIPNPASSKVKLVLEDVATLQSIVAVSANGLVESQLNTEFVNGEFTIDVSDLTNGLWFLRIRHEGKDSTLKLVIMR